MNATLDVRVLLHGEAVDNLRFTQPVIRIGRERDAQGAVNDIVLTSKGVSRSHAQILVGDDGVTVIDRSRHGTFINGERLHGPRRLEARDVVEIDAYTIQCELAAGTPVTAPAVTPVNRPVTSPPLPDTTAAELNLVPLDDDLPSFDLGDLGDLRDSTPPRVETLPVVAPRVADAPAVPRLPELPGPESLHAAPHAAPVTIAAVAPAVAPTSAPETSPLALAYRELAAQHGASRWGQPPALAHGDLPRATEAARRLLGSRMQALPAGVPWPERLARELCGLGPLDDLLDDVSVTALSVRGTAAIDVRRGDAREPAAARFSCVEAIHAMLERWTGQRLGERGQLEAGPVEGTSVLALDRNLAPGGPIVHVTRARRPGHTVEGSPAALAGLVGERMLPQAAADLLAECVRRGRTLLLHGDASADLSTLTRALIAARPTDRSAAIVRRSGAWDPRELFILAGERPGALAAARRLDPDWLVVEEIEATDAGELCGGVRHPGGGTIGTLRARSAEAALARLTALFAAANGWSDLQAARAVVTTGFDVFVGLRRASDGRSVVHTISEARSGARAELAELFTWNADIAGILPTDVEIHLLR
ncbi:MAG TPA: FHA domain-containing protein [Nannocystis sp.]|jgi:Flp pilus assembly CpaF family ATPase